MIQKLLKMNALLLDMLKTRSELNGDWKPEWDKNESIWEIYFTAEGNIITRSSTYKSFHPFHFKKFNSAEKFIAKHDGDLYEYDALLWNMK